MVAMYHSVLIPHRNLHRRLDLCVWSLERSALACGPADWECVVIDSSEPPWETASPVVRVVRQAQDGPYCKSRAYNHGLDATDSEVVTFLDVDAIVGSRFLLGTCVLLDHSIIRACYRVRKLPPCEVEGISLSANRDDYVAGLFEKYGEYPMAYEAYDHHDLNRPSKGKPWGNSQFSIRRRALGDLRFDEAYAGRGQEDLDMNMQIEAAYRDKYQGFLWKDADHAMFHLDRDADVDPLWIDRKLLAKNASHYVKRRTALLGR